MPLTLKKRRGQTPLQAIEEWRRTHPEHSTIPASYAGRLDPMAEGKLLVLLGEECKQQKLYRKLDKEYRIEVVLDLSTDTGDALGLPTLTDVQSFPVTVEVARALDAVRGSHMVPYPAFSSKTVQGKPLFLYALEQTLNTIDIPTHPETIYRIFCEKTLLISKNDLRERISTALRDVPRSDEPSKVLGADFRQDAIRSAWESTFTTLPDRMFTILTLRVVCASGTYMRTLAERLGNELGTHGFALSIDRTKIGKYRTFGPFAFWSKQY